MAYSPIDNGSFVPGTLGTDSAWNSVISNDAQLYSSLSPVFAVSCHTFTVTGASAAEVAYFALPANYDNLPYTVAFLYGQTGSSAGIELKVTDGSAQDSTTTTVTASSGSSSVSVTPSSTSASSTPRYGILSLSATSGQTINVVSFIVYTTPATAGAGLLSSGYASVGSTWNATEAPIPSRVVSRLVNNPYLIAKDRPNALYSFVSQTQNARNGLITTGETDYQFVLRPYIGKQPKKERTFRVWAYVERYNTAKANVLVTVGNELVVLLDNFGIMTSTFTATGESVNAMANANKVEIRVSSGSGNVALRTLQILEEPS
tara:strand:- start:2692 stop:3645 length:954 start_codon:yes stop_codon:yes gene_type:complete